MQFIQAPDFTGKHDMMLALSQINGRWHLARGELYYVEGRLHRVDCRGISLWSSSYAVGVTCKLTFIQNIEPPTGPEPILQATLLQAEWTDGLPSGPEINLGRVEATIDSENIKN